MSAAGTAAGLEADMLGHDTHGLELAVRYLGEIEGGGMAVAGEPEVLSDRGACLAWDGRRLPGPWLVTRTLELAFELVSQYGVVSVAIGNSHHIGCLAAYLERAAARGMVLSLHSSAPGVATTALVAPIAIILQLDPRPAGFTRCSW
ncbi:MAG TPA: Ldh family oxidoreductase [Roseomonas sp.]|nr:Ldh family oxidoreductase [Roseomonas sp.]